MQRNTTRGCDWPQSALAFFDSRGIDPRVARACGVRAEDDGLVFPVASPDGKSFERRRPLVDGGHSRQPRGTPLCMWWLRGPKKAQNVLVVEGESDALAAETALAAAGPPLREMATAALPGTGYPAHRAAAELRRRGTQRVWMALDGDPAGRAMGDRLAEALAKQGIACMEITLDEGTDLADNLRDASDPAAWLADAVDGAQPRGERAADVYDLAEASLFRAAGSLRRAGFCHSAIQAALVAENAERDIPLDAGTVERIASQAVRWEDPPEWLVDPVAFVEDPRLRGRERLVLFVLCLRAQVDGTRKIGVRRVAELAGVNKNTAHRALRRLVELDRVRVVDRGRMRECATYRLLPRPSVPDAGVHTEETELPERSASTSRNGPPPYRRKVSPSSSPGHELRAASPNAEHEEAA